MIISHALLRTSLSFAPALPNVPNIPIATPTHSAILERTGDMNSKTLTKSWNTGVKSWITNVKALNIVVTAIKAPLTTPPKKLASICKTGIKAWAKIDKTGWTAFHNPTKASTTIDIAGPAIPAKTWKALVKAGIIAPAKSAIPEKSSLASPPAIISTTPKNTSAIVENSSGNSEKLVLILSITGCKLVINVWPIPFRGLESESPTPRLSINFFPWPTIIGPNSLIACTIAPGRALNIFPTIGSKFPKRKVPVVVIKLDKGSLIFSPSAKAPIKSSALAFIALKDPSRVSLASKAVVPVISSSPWITWIALNTSSRLLMSYLIPVSFSASAKSLSISDFVPPYIYIRHKSLVYDRSLMNYYIFLYRLDYIFMLSHTPCFHSLECTCFRNSR